MKDNAAILLEALARKYGPPRVSAEYGKELLAIAKACGLDDQELGRRAGLRVNKPGDAAISRIRNGASATTAWKVYRALVDAGCDVPPIVLGSADDEVARWTRAGVEVARARREDFLAWLAEVEDHAAVVRKQRPVLGTRGVRIGPEPVPLPGSSSENDRPPPYSGPHGQADKDPLDPPRKPPPRRRR